MFTTNQILHPAPGTPSAWDWAVPDDGFLALDRDSNGAIDSGSGISGIGANLADIRRTANRYQSLSGMDPDGDRLISAADVHFSRLMAGMDGDGEVASTAGEPPSLASPGIRQLTPHVWAHSATGDQDAAAGYAQDMAHAWIETRQPVSIPAVSVAQVAVPANAQMPAVNAPATPVTGEHVSPDVTGGALNDTRPLSVAIESLADALAAFNGNGAIAETLPRIEAQPLTPASGTGSELAVRLPGIVNALKQFDANGQPIAMPPGTTGPVPVDLDTSKIVKPQPEMLASVEHDTPT